MHSLFTADLTIDKTTTEGVETCMDTPRSDPLYTQVSGRDLGTAGSFILVVGPHPIVKRVILDRVSPRTISISPDAVVLPPECAVCEALVLEDVDFWDGERLNRVLPVVEAWATSTGKLAFLTASNLSHHSDITSSLTTVPHIVFITDPGQKWSALHQINRILDANTGRRRLLAVAPQAAACHES